MRSILIPTLQFSCNTYKCIFNICGILLMQWKVLMSRFVTKVRLWEASHVTGACYFSWSVSIEHTWGARGEHVKRKGGPSWQAPVIFLLNFIYKARSALGGHAKRKGGLIFFSSPVPLPSRFPPLPLRKPAPPTQAMKKHTENHWTRLLASNLFSVGWDQLVTVGTRLINVKWLWTLSDPY